MKQYTMSYNPEQVTPLTNGMLRVFYEITESEETIVHVDEETKETTEDTHPVWLCSGIDTDLPLVASSYEQLVILIIRDRYSIDDELAILRQRDTKTEEFDAYYEFAEYAKLFVKDLVGM